MVNTAYLRVYQPVESFDEAERSHWFDGVAEGEQRDSKASTTWLLSSSLPAIPPLLGGPQGAFVRASGERILVCPWRTRLRMLAGLLAFRSSIPEEIADAFVPEAAARLAAHELAALDQEHPDVRSHILHANWHVPLRWFAAFDDSERILTEDKDGLRIRYEAKLADARVRLQRTLSVLENNWIDDAVTVAIRELLEWLEEFDGDGLIELDYASVASMFPDDELVEDHSAAEVSACIDALEAEDVVRAGRLFGMLTDRWTEVRAREVVN